MDAETCSFVSVLLQKVGLAHLFRICLLKLKDETALARVKKAGIRLSTARKGSRGKCADSMSEIHSES
jgi:hypothetical protein